MNWNDLRYFLEVGRCGSTLSASRKLRVSQTTVARRITALENVLKLTLFDRHQAGYSLTPAGEELLDHARQVEASAGAISQAAEAQHRELSGTVRITTEEVYGVTLLPPLLSTLHRQHPGIIIEVDLSQELRDLGAGEADIALRSMSREHEAGLVGRRLCPGDWTVYCSAEYAARNGAPSTLKALKRHPIIAGGGADVWRAYKSWLEQVGLAGQVAMHQTSVLGMLSAVRSGVGVAVLPCIVADADPELVQCLRPQTAHDRSLWLLTHERVRRTPRVRVVMDYLTQALVQHVRQLAEPQEGRPGRSKAKLVRVRTPPN